MERQAMVLATRIGGAASVLAAVLVLVAACQAGPAYGPDAYELGNIDPSNEIPKASPAQLADTFERFCIDGPRQFDAAESGLRKAGFVPRPTRGDYVTFVSDDRRPAVKVSVRGAACMVESLSRTGQSERLADLVRRRFPEARPLEALQGRRDLERVWQLDSGIVFLMRSGSPYATSRLMFGIWHGSPASRHAADHRLPAI